MTNRSKAKGTAHESSIVKCLIEHGWPYAERRALSGNSDRGDINFSPGVVIEAKACKTPSIPAWLRELDAEIVNAGAITGAVWAKSVGKADAADGYVVMRPAVYLALLKAAGH